MENVTELTGKISLTKQQITTTLFYGLGIVLTVFDSIIADIAPWPHLLIYFVFLYGYSQTIKQETRKFELRKLFPISDEDFKLISVITLIILTIILTFLFLDTDVSIIREFNERRQEFQISSIDRDKGLLNFTQYLTLTILLSGITIKIFNDGRIFSSADKLTTDIKKTIYQLLLISYFSLILLIPPFLVHSKKTEVNFLQHQFLLTIMLLTVVFVLRDDLVFYFTKNTRNKTYIIFISSGYLLFDFIMISLSINTQANLLAFVILSFVNASTLILISAGLTLTTRVRKFGNFAQAEFVTVGLFFSVVALRDFRSMTWLGDRTSPIGKTFFGWLGDNTGFGNNIFGWMFVALMLTGFIGILAELLVFAPLGRRSATPLSLMVASIGLGLVLRQGIQEIFSGVDQQRIAPRYPVFFDRISQGDDPFITILGNDIDVFFFLFGITIVIGLLVAFIGSDTNQEKTKTLGHALVIGGFFSYAAQNIGDSLPIFMFLGLAYAVYYSYFRITGAVDERSTADYAVIILDLIGLLFAGLFLGFFLGHFIGYIFTDLSIIVLGDLRVDFLNIQIELFDPITVIIIRDQTWAFLVMIISISILRFILTKTTLGISMRATADDDELAQITGINTRRVVYWTWFIAAGVTGMGALYRFANASFTPVSGFTLLLLIFAVVILGGFDSFEGTLISAFIVAGVMSMTTLINQELNAWERIKGEDSDIDKLVFWTSSSDYSQVIPFAIIILVLLFRPRGIFGLVDPKSKL